MDNKTNKPTYEQLEAQVKALAAENAALKTAHPQPFGQEMMKALDAYEKHQDDVPETGMLDAFFIMRDSIRVDTAATDTYLSRLRNEARAKAIPEGYVLVPEQMYLEAGDIESICSQCGDGHENGYGDFTGAILWVGELADDDGKVKYGLNIASSECPEEGSVAIYEFAELSEGKAGEDAQ